MRSDRLRLTVAEVLADGGPIEDEMDAADQVLDALDAAGYRIIPDSRPARAAAVAQLADAGVIWRPAVDGRGWGSFRGTV